MATSAQLLKAQEAGAEIRITIAGQPEGGIVEYSPRHKGDRKPWVYQSGRYVTEGHRYAAKDVAAVTAPVTKALEEAPKAVTQEMIEALATLRGLESETHPLLAARKALRTLYAAGVFAAIDAAADAKPEPFCNCGDDATSACIIAGHRKAPERLLKGGSTRRADAKVAEQASKCTCHPAPDARSEHEWGCPEHADNRLYYGSKNIAARAKEARRESIRRAVGLKF